MTVRLERDERVVYYWSSIELIVAGTHENATVVEAIYAKVNDLCGDDVHINAPAKRYHWTFYHSFFFSFIVCSTIGYGNISPSTPFGKMFMILYALIGIPVNGFLFAGLGDYFSRTVRTNCQHLLVALLMFITTHISPHPPPTSSSRAFISGTKCTKWRRKRTICRCDSR